MDYRHFRLDRVKQAARTSQIFNKQHPALKTFIEQLSYEQPVHTIVIRIDKQAVKYLGDQKYYSGYISERDMGACVEMTFLTYSIIGFARWYMMFGHHAEVVSPDSLKDEIRRSVERISERLK